MLHRPLKTILFLLPLIVAMYLAPIIEDEFLKEEKQITVEIPEWSELLDTIKVEVDTTLLIDTLTIDSVIVDSIKIDFNRWVPDYVNDSLPDSIKINGANHLHSFFAKLESISSEDTEPIEIFHWGDSQIEGDRISGVLRSSWQKSWGGSGPGMLPAVQPIPALSVRQENYGNWSRYTRFGQVDSTLEHSAYGVMAAFGLTNGDGTLIIKPHPSGFKLNKVWDRIKISIGGAPLGGNITIQGTANNYRAFSIRPASKSMHQEITSQLEPNEKELRIGFEGYMLEITGVELGSEYGVQFHNIPMRGSAGMLFTKLDSRHFIKQINDRNTGLMILQFGGNVVPYINDSISAKRYGLRFAKQLQYLKSIKPHVPILVIGPSDMGDENKYPFLETVVENIEDAALREGCMYWNLFEAMGGRGTMVKWANAEPKLASPDLVHFNPKGARIVGELLDQAIREEYKNWVEWNR